MYTLGVLPIDSMKDWRGPLDVVCSQIPKRVFEMVYGIIVKTKDAEGIDEIRDCYPEELAGAFAIGRGYRRGTQGQPDEHRAARLMLKDYVNVRPVSFLARRNCFWRYLFEFTPTLSPRPPFIPFASTHT